MAVAGRRMCEYEEYERLQSGQGSTLLSDTNKSISCGQHAGGTLNAMRNSKSHRGGPQTFGSMFVDFDAFAEAAMSVCLCVSVLCWLSLLEQIVRRGLYAPYSSDT